MRLFQRLAWTAILLASGSGAIGQTPPPDAAWQAQRDTLVERFRRLIGRENEFGPAWAPIYQAARPWYELWGGKTRHEVDAWMVPPDAYAAELAAAWEGHRNYFAADPRGNIPEVFTARLSGGRLLATNYWLDLPTGFGQGETGRTWPLIVGLHGSGWLGHPLSYVRGRADTGRPVRTFSVTPIDAAGPWQLDYLNAFLDYLLRTLPIDPDRVYVEGHSLGGMATWEWAEQNPERFAAISPRAGAGDPYRAIRLLHVPAWPIHGEEDRVVPRLFDEQMVSALQNLGAPVRYSVLSGVEHNMPGDLDEETVIDWYLRQTRYHGAEAADPRDQLGIGPDGASARSLIREPGRYYFVSRPLRSLKFDEFAAVVGELGDAVHQAKLTADAPLEEIHSEGTPEFRLRLPVPSGLRTEVPPPAGARLIPGAQYVRFYFRGPVEAGLKYAGKVAADAFASGQLPDDGAMVVIPLSLWRDRPDSIAEYRIPLRQP